MNSKIQSKFNEQVNHEFGAAYLYLSMAAYFESRNLNGFATWMKKQAQEEQLHAMKFYDHLFERSADVQLLALEQPKTKWSSCKEAFEDALKHEQKVTALINDMMNLATSLKDHASVAFLQWFVTEQVEEEASVSDIIEKLKLVGDNKGGLYMLDKELGARQ